MIITSLCYDYYKSVLLLLLDSFADPMLICIRKLRLSFLFLKSPVSPLRHLWNNTRIPEVQVQNETSDHRVIAWLIPLHQQLNDTKMLRSKVTNTRWSVFLFSSGDSEELILNNGRSGRVIPDENKDNGHFGWAAKANLPENDCFKMAAGCFSSNHLQSLALMFLYTLPHVHQALG